MTTSFPESVTGLHNSEAARDSARGTLWLAWLISLAGSGCAVLGALTQEYVVAASTALGGHAIAFVLCAIALASLRGSTFGAGVLAISVGLPQVLNLALSLSVLSETLRPYGGKLAVLHYAGYRGVEDVFPFYALLLILTSLGSVPLYLARRAPRYPCSQVSYRTVTILLLVGALGLGVTLLADRAESFASRGDGSSQGVVTLAYWAAAVGIACLVAEVTTDKASRALWLFGGIELIGLLLAANRTPLILVGCAVVIRLANDRPKLLATVLPAMLPLALLVASYLSVWRGRLRDSLPSAPGDVLSQIAHDPVGSFLNVGVDSVDGYFLSSRLLANGFPAQPLDPLIAILNFVPRAVWEAKPTLLGSRIGVDYLGFSSGGIFLSGPGYMALVLGSVVLGAILFTLIILLTRVLFNTFWSISILSVCGLFFMLNFTIAGDAFNLFLALQAALLWYFSRTLARLTRRVVAN